tara:strand:+ start:8788 stop:8931 length:144 start_codon:yes stop_codon:yes gene_type:complete
VTSPTSKEDKDKVIPLKQDQTALKKSFLSSTIDELISCMAISTATIQ